jgi:FixJ family two-component response regulator
MTTRINVIDPDVRRRASVARQLIARGFHAEIFEDIAEFGQTGTMTGLVFLSDACGLEVDESIQGVRSATAMVLPIVFYGEDPAPENVVDAVRAGVSDYLRWPFTARLLDRVFRRHTDDDKLLQKESLRNEARAKVQELSGRETNVLTLLIQGLSNKGIARTLGISHRTVEIHRANMMHKLGAHTTPDAIRIGMYAGLDETPEPIELVAAA